ncbi:hypothetical protein EV182_006966, partial [Spiromyces aspiralis]
ALIIATNCLYIRYQAVFPRDKPKSPGGDGGNKDKWIRAFKGCAFAVIATLSAINDRTLFTARTGRLTKSGVCAISPNFSENTKHFGEIMFWTQLAGLVLACIGFCFYGGIAVKR